MITIIISIRIIIINIIGESSRVFIGDQSCMVLAWFFRTSVLSTCMCLHLGKRVLHRLQCHVSATSQNYLVFRQLQHCAMLLLQPPRLPDCTHASKWSRSLRSNQSSELHCSSNDAMSAASCLQMSARVYCSRISLRSI